MTAKAKSTKTKKKAVSSDPRAALAAFGRRLRKPRIEQVGAEMVTYVKETGPSIARIAEELGTLELAARTKLVELAEVLIGFGVDPNVPGPRQPGGERIALANVFEAEDRDDPASERLLRLLLDAGADPNAACSNYNGRVEAALDRAVYRSSRVGVKVLRDKVNDTSKANAMCTMLAMLIAYSPFKPHVEWLCELLELLPVDGFGFDGMSPVHAAAACGDAELFARVQDRASDKVPRLPKPVSWELRISPPPGGISNTVLLPAGATPLFVARAVRSKFAQYLALWRAAVDPSRNSSIASLERMLAEYGKVIERLEGQGVVDELRAPELPEALSSVLSASNTIAEHLGMAGFIEKAATIDPTGKGPFGYFLSCIDLMIPALDDQARERLDSTLVGKFVTGSLHCQVLVEDEDDPFEGLAPGPNDVRIRLDDYPESARVLLEQGTHYGVNGDNIVTLENSTGITKLWEIGPDAVIEHGDVVKWLTRSVGELTAAT